MRFGCLVYPIIAFATLTAGPAQAVESMYSVPTGDEHVANVDTTSDPWRSFNEPVFNFNVGVDRYGLKPVSDAYHHIPSPLRHNVDNFVTNLEEPLNTVHGILQGNPSIAFTSLWRFILNTSFGLCGLRDFAGENGLHNKDQNFGKTLGRWGFDAGPYLVLPLLGPSSARGAVGKAGDYFLDPMTWALTWPEGIAEGVTQGIDMRDKNNDIINSIYYESLDPYVAMRSMYRQHEAYDVQKKE